MTVIQKCAYDGPDHEFPDDWEFGGADGTDPRTDARWRPLTFEYWSDHFEMVWVSQTPLCLHQAMDEFTWVRDTFAHNKGHTPRYLFVKTVTSWAQVAVEYISPEDTIYPIDFLKNDPIHPSKYPAGIVSFAYTPAEWEKVNSGA